ncbi:MAG: hypothetical protein Q7S03_02180 [bacterium]|nr:hypothetical protein [bacterium]
MAKVKNLPAGSQELKNKKTKRQNKDIPPKKFESWFENKIGRIRGVLEPHASRASRLIILISALIFVFITFYSSTLPKNRFEQTKEMLLRNSEDKRAHLLLAEEFLKNNQLGQVKKELEIVGRLHAEGESQQKVLGLSSQLSDLWQKWQNQDPEELKKKVGDWENIISQTPSYRNGYLELTLLYFKLGEKDKARESLGKALELDPNYEAAREIKTQLK